MNQSKEPTLVHRKLAVLGPKAAGKSCLIHAFVAGGSFSESYEPTIETTHNKTIRFRKVHFETDIVDTAGMDEYSRLSRNASLGVHGYVLVFDMTQRTSFDQIKLVNETLLDTLTSTDVPRVLVGTKKDMVEQRQVLSPEAEHLAESWNVHYIECSSKTGERVAEVFHTCLKDAEKDDLLEQGLDGGCIVL